ncbi:hypothetical protein [Desulfobaculum sp.]
MPQTTDTHTAPALSNSTIAPDTATILREVKRLHADCGLGHLPSIITDTHATILRLFRGDMPGYRKSTAPYHDLEHTLSVVLASARLVHGISTTRTVSANLFTVAVVAAYFHDSGMLQDETDTSGTGAKHTIGHEDRSIAIMRSLLATHAVPAHTCDAIASAIDCTRLALTPADIAFPTADAKDAGLIVGSADLIAQLADRKYLEKLPLLFKEFQEARIPGYVTQRDLFQKTAPFYHNVVRPRLDHDLGAVTRFMRLHFLHRFGLDHDPYQHAIDANLGHLRYLLKTSGPNDITTKLRRKNDVLHVSETV